MNERLEKFKNYQYFSLINIIINSIIFNENSLDSELYEFKIFIKLKLENNNNFINISNEH